MSNLTSILKSFKLKKNLNPKIWIKNGEEMSPKVREKLLEIADNFIEDLNVDIIVSDIIMTGSLSNFNWSNFSDVDLHILVDFKQFSEKELPLYEELFKLKKTLYNQKHDILIYGYDVELYVQDENETHFSSGVYSVLNNEWVNKPKKEKIKVDIDLIKNKINQWVEIIDGVIENSKDEDVETAKQIISKYKDKLKKYRTCGLEKDGEFSDENLVFKALRRNGYIQKLFDFENEIVDKNYSLKESTTIEGTFRSDKENEISKNSETSITDKYKNSNFLDKIIELSEKNVEYKNLKKPKSRIPYDSDVEVIQTALQFLGFSLPKWGVDGRFGPETEKAVRDFESELGLDEDGIMDSDDLESLHEALVSEGFTEENLGKIQKTPNYDSMSTGDVILTGNFDSTQKNNIKLMIDYMNKSGITDPLTQIGILSVISKESNFKPKSEVSYAGTSNSRIRSIFGSRVAKYSDSELNDLKSDPQKFFNMVYAKTVGNQGGNDGWNYRGRGFNQLTGRKNYEKYGKIIGRDLVGNPDLVNDPEVAAEIAIAFFTKNKPASSFPMFDDKEDAASYFTDINAGGGVSSDRSKAIAASDKFDIESNIT